MRSVIAKRLTESKQTSPHGHATAASDISSILKIRKRVNLNFVRFFNIFLNQPLDFFLNQPLDFLTF